MKQLSEWVGQELGVTIAGRGSKKPWLCGSYGGVLTDAPELDPEAEARGEGATFLLRLDGGEALVMICADYLTNATLRDDGVLDVEMSDVIISIAPRR